MMKGVRLVAGGMLCAAAMFVWAAGSAFAAKPEDDLFALMDPLDREANWSDTYHYKPVAISLQVNHVSAACRKALMGMGVAGGCD